LSQLAGLSIPKLLLFNTMATDAIVTLERLRCIKESDGSGHSEPFIWPVLIWIDTSNGNVNMADLVLGNARVVIRNNMRAGETVDIPASVRTLRVRFADNPQRFILILSVVLWENDETPEAAMRAGFKAFSSGLKEAVIANLLELRAAQGNPAAEAAVRAKIEKQVKEAVEEAIKGGLTTSQKLRVKLGTLNLDDVVGSDTESLGSVGQTASTRAFTLTFSNQSGSEQYEITGNLAGKPVPVEACQAEVNAVNGALATIENIRNQIRSLQEELRNAPGPQKAGIIAMIREQQAELPAATAVLEQARKALQVCRSRQVNEPIFDVPGGGVLLDVDD